MLNCQHHIAWVREVDGGLHQCILCTQVVTKKDVHPKLEDLPEDFRRRWDAHEATRPAPATEETTANAPAPAAKPATAPAAASPTATPTAPPAPTSPETPPIPRAPPASRIPASTVPPVDPHPRG